MGFNQNESVKSYAETPQYFVSMPLIPQSYGPAVGIGFGALAGTKTKPPTSEAIHRTGSLNLAGHDPHLP